MKRLLLILFFLALIFELKATHNRAGEITYRQISELTYEITVVTYTCTGPGPVADRPKLEINWGDNTSELVQRDPPIALPNYYQYNKYVAQHTYPGPGTYEILVEDPNRNAGVQNIAGSVEVVFCIKTILEINPFIGVNNTPVLLNPPYDQAGVNQIYIHNPGAYDSDGDSLSYKLVPCLGENGKPIPNYQLPAHSNSISINEITGDFIWNTPVKIGIYNIAIAIEEWREGVKIGQIIRDMQIEVKETDNKPPVLNVPNEICVQAGDTVKFDVVATDDLSQKITLTSYGGVYEVTENSANFEQPVSGYGKVSSHFEWVTSCSHIRRFPYMVTFKAKDNYHNIPLVNNQNTNIKVVAPPPINLTLEPTNREIKVFWEVGGCDNIEGYYIYRKPEYYGFDPADCEIGVPSYTGYEKIATVGKDNPSYVDKDVTHGFMYCYMITKYYKDGAESYASEEKCEDLVRGIPIITMVSVDSTDIKDGIIDIEWAKPTELDINQVPGPYRYLVFPGKDLASGYSDPHIVEGLDNTTFRDTDVNTEEFPYVYQVGLYNKDPDTGEWVNIGIPENASSVYLNTTASDNSSIITFTKDVPWINEKYIIYRQKTAGEFTAKADFDSIGYTVTDTFVDKGLQNGQRYWYYAKSIGHYNIENIKDPIVNFSQINSCIPIDTFPPCLPPLNVKSECEQKRNHLTWTNPNDICCNDVIKYNIYYSPTQNSKVELIDSILSPNAPLKTNYYHYPKSVGEFKPSLAGCYTVTAIDSFYNESPPIYKTCVDVCINYKLPNVFTPDGDGINDLFKAFPYEFVEKVEMKIFNRWGQLVYETTDPDINWDGKYKDSDKIVSDGVYYYICDVYERRLTGIEPRNITGFIHIYTGEGNKN